MWWTWILLPQIVSPQRSFYDLVLQNSSYNKYVSPYEINGKPMIIHLRVPFQVVVSVEEDQQIATYVISLNLTWHDPRLAFDENELGTDMALIASSLLWLPRLGMYNSLKVEFPDTETDSDEIQVFPDGMVTQRIKGRFETICQCDVENFPFDTQYCSIDFDAGMNPVEKLLIWPTASYPPQAQILGNPEWDIDTQLASNISYQWSTRSFSMAKITVKLKRNPQFYLTFMVTPIVVISVTCFAALLLPIGLSTGDRINLGLTCFLGLAFMLSIIVNEIPRSSTIPLLGQWVLVQMFLCAIAIFIDWPLSYFKNLIRKRLIKCDKKCKIINLLLDSSMFLLISTANMIASIVQFVDAANREKVQNESII